jgi:HEAT repeat protein
LNLAEEFAARGDQDSATRIVRAGLKDADSTLRASAAELAVKLDHQDSTALLPLLRDPEIMVRRRVLEAVANSPELATDEDLLPLLHDGEATLRARCETILRARGLTDKEIQLGRLLTDPSPLKRLQLIDRLPADADLDPEAWLKRLTQDPSPVVRIGAARAAMDPTSPLGVDLTPRVREMAQSDPDGTVRQIADYLIRNRAQP